MLLFDGYETCVALFSTVVFRTVLLQFVDVVYDGGVLVVVYSGSC